ncbi:hypothetical protein CHH27_03120 [Labrenzia sp. VG12]|nr:hypothetical protein CHH27_03120 [Labrenzia sp. VG12]
MAVEQPSAKYKNLVETGQLRSQVGISSEVSLSQLYVNEQDMFNHIKMNELAGDCSGDANDSPEYCDDWPKELVKPIVWKQASRQCKNGNQAIIKAWNLTISLDIENKSTVPVKFSFQKAVFDVRNDPLIIASSIANHQEIETDDFIKPFGGRSTYRVVKDASSLQEYFVGSKETEIGSGYKNSLGFKSQIYIPFECDEHEKILTVILNAKVGHINVPKDLPENFSTTEKEIVISCRLGRI